MTIMINNDRVVEIWVLPIYASVEEEKTFDCYRCQDIYIIYIISTGC